MICLSHAPLCARQRDCLFETLIVLRIEKWILTDESALRTVPDFVEDSAEGARSYLPLLHMELVERISMVGSNIAIQLIISNVVGCLLWQFWVFRSCCVHHKPLCYYERKGCKWGVALRIICNGNGNLDVQSQPWLASQSHPVQTQRVYRKKRIPSHHLVLECWMNIDASNVQDCK